MKFVVNILGCGAATPTLQRRPSSQLLDIHDKYFLVDCGEGTQINLRKHKFKFQRINNIFISHLHGDHFFGLIGLISSMHLLGRSKELHLYAPAPLEELIQANLKASETYLNFPLVFHATDSKNKELIYEDKTLEIYSFPLRHRIPCTGFLFQEKPKKRKLNKELVEEANLNLQEILSLRRSEDVTRDNGEEFKFADFTSEAPKALSYAYCSDTSYLPSLENSIKGCTAIYHESTFLKDLSARAKQTYHSTAEQAGKIAKLCEVSVLILGHYSSRYRNVEDFKTEAELEFHNVILGDDGMKIDLQSISP